MEWVGLSLGLLGLAVGIIPLALTSDVPLQEHAPLAYLAATLMIVGFVIGLQPLREPMLRSSRIRFGRYPLFLMYLFADMFADGKRDREITKQFRLALQDDYTSGAQWSDLESQKEMLFKIIDAAIGEKLTLYGRLVTDRGTLRFLTKVPPEHLRTYKIETIVALQRLSNKYVYTYDPRIEEK
jgi:hypothetical protein